MRSHSNQKGSLILCVAALLWGMALIFQSNAADRIPPFLVNCLRSLIGALFLLLLLLLRKAFFGHPIFPKNTSEKKRMLAAGLLCGTFLTACLGFQQAAFSAYPAGIAAEARIGFLTALYVLFVPLWEMIRKKKRNANFFLAILPAMFGIYLLCLSDGLHGFYLGDILACLCAVCYALHILSVSHFREADGMLLSLLQLGTCALLSGTVSLLFEEMPSADAIFACVPHFLYLGIVSGGIAYTLQIVGQKYAEPTVASISMSFECIFSALCGWLFLDHPLTVREWLGCFLMFGAILLAQLPPIPINAIKKRTRSAPK